MPIPRFEMRTKYDLMPHLILMGMPYVFIEYVADLTGMADITTLPGNIYLTGATHDASVKVNEEGTEAAAVTVLVAGMDSEIPPLPRFVAGPPFISLIQDDESGAVLFMGRVMDPTAR